MVLRNIDTVIRDPDSALITVTWLASAAAGDTFQAFDLKDQGGISDAILSISGTIATGVFGAEHSVDDSIYGDCKDPSDTVIALSTLTNAEIRGFGRYIKPKLNSGTPTSIVCVLQFRRASK